MKTDKELRYEMLVAKNYGVEQAKNGYQFVQDADTTTPAEEPTSVDGIYLKYADGHREIFTGTNSKDNVAYIGVALNGQRFCVSLKQADEAELLPEGKEATKWHDSIYKKRECDAIYDFESEANTDQLCKDNPELRDVIGGDFIPALGILVIMARNRELINYALEYVGGDLLTDSLYWSSTEISTNIAWDVYFSYGSISTGYKYYGSAVRAVAAF